uniref:Uncharacterized protein n=1 Tax=Pristionchus pacificus TaxID=54126 RepID=A0A2A6B8Y5_PRIPA|eukprot:PDM62352.1 hypothetical protein PRIPAC_51794 [Pristionchus pacificus]
MKHICSRLVRSRNAGSAFAICASCVKEARAACGSAQPTQAIYKDMNISSAILILAVLNIRN